MWGDTTQSVRSVSGNQAVCRDLQTDGVPQLLSGLSFAEWWESPSGLWLPSSLRDSVFPDDAPPFAGLLIAQRQEELEGYAAFATPKEIGWPSMTLSELATAISQMPREIVLAACSGLQARLWAIQTDPEGHLALAREVFGTKGAGRRLAAYLQNGPGRRVTFSQQGVTLLQWIAIFHGGVGLKPELDRDHQATLGHCLLAVADHIDGDVLPTTRGSSDAWLTYLTQNFVFNAKPELGNSIARTWCIFGRLAQELGENDVPTYAPFADWLEQDYKLTLAQQLTLSFAIHAHLGVAQDRDGRHRTVIGRDFLDDLYRRMGLSDEQRESADALLAAPIEWFRERIEGRDAARASWNLVPFMQRPFLRLESGRLLLLSPRALEAWMVDGPYYRGLDAAIKRGRILDFTAYVGHLTERYALELVKSVHPEPRVPVAGQVYGDKTYGPGLHSSDLTITYPHEAVVIEVSSPRFTIESRCEGDTEAMRKDLYEIIGKRVKQLDRSIEGMKPAGPRREPPLTYPRIEGRKVARFWPLVVTAVPLRWTPVLADYLDEAAPDCLVRDDVEELDVLDLEELEGLAAVVERSGTRFADLLARKRDEAGPHAEVPRWLMKQRDLPNVSRPEYLNDALDEALDLVTELLGFDVEAVREQARERRLAS